jgi:glycosyltransferase involved in cell wall biosynthesis
MTGLRVACVYRNGQRPELRLTDMSWIRFFRMAHAFAARGHQVDIVMNRRDQPEMVSRGLREVPFRFVRWEDYDVVKTFFHLGFEALVAEGGGGHPWIVSKLGSVVGRGDTPGVYFFGAVRQRLFETQQEIARSSRVVTVLTQQSADLWRHEHGSKSPLLQVPTGVDAAIPALGPSPYVSLGIPGPIVLYAGNLYSRTQQAEVNLLWQDRLNRVGRLLRRLGITLVAIGPGDTDLIDRDAVVHLGEIDADEVWDWQRHARVGLVLAQGAVQHNESSKIYYYLRTGLPVVCEAPVPNVWLIEKTGHGAIVDYGDVEGVAEAAARLATHPPAPNGVIDYVISRHSWGARAALYEQVFANASLRNQAPVFRVE